MIVGTQEECYDTLLLSDYIQINPNPIANFTYSIEFQNTCDIGIEFHVPNDGLETFNWDFNNGISSTLSNPIEIFEYNEPFEVVLEVENEFSCTDTISKIIEVVEFKPIFVPNTFTPNEDNKNDIFHPISACIEEIEFWIYDRWGKQVFYSQEINHGWDGKFDGILLKNDSYSWRLKYYHNDKLIDENGFVVLLK